jgi:pimeloyl-ACP methyl ester carboxylesterase
MVAGVSNLSDPIRPSDPFYEYWHHCKRGVPAPFLEKIAEEASEMPASRWRAILEMIRRIDLRGQTSRLRDIETLIINGSDDELFDAGDREMFAAALPWARLLEIDGCGHNLHWEEPARVAAIVSARFPTNQPPR